MNSQDGKKIILQEQSLIDRPAEKDERMAWWLGLTDLGGQSLTHLVLGVERAHLAIADETFNALAQIPITKPVSEPVRSVHHGISRLCYRSLAAAGELLGTALSGSGNKQP